jgi:hypothetical protein
MKRLDECNFEEKVEIIRGKLKEAERFLDDGLSDRLYNDFHAASSCIASAYNMLIDTKKDWGEAPK